MKNGAKIQDSRAEIYGCFSSKFDAKFKVCERKNQIKIEVLKLPEKKFKILIKNC